uniref:RNase-like major storage protein n=1 Tax=Panax notoginseng TaxID=44586 RepID=X2D3J9_9APIA|nr:RNase-like major storage protein [Panax notoginseng]
MRAIYIISVIIVSLRIFSCGGNARTDYPWAMFALRLQWPAGFCEVNNDCDTKSLLNTFTIHGLYPYNAKMAPGLYCDGTAFDVNSVSDFQAEMHLAWPSHETNTEDKQFWEHEWKKHGRCSEALLKQTDYFRTALAFRKAFDIIGLLNQEGIYPNNDLYRPKMIKEAIKKHLNAVPEIDFTKNENSEYVLTDINLCVNQQATRFVDCPTDDATDDYRLKFVRLPSKMKITDPRTNSII